MRTIGINPARQRQRASTVFVCLRSILRDIYASPAPDCSASDGAAIEKPVVREHQLTVGHEMNATLSCDHRIIDGAMAAAYLQTLRQLIENPGTLLV